MKRFFCALMALALMLTAAGCGSDTKGGGSSSGGAKSAVSEESSQSAPEPEPTEEPTPEPEKELSLADGEVRLVYCGGEVLAVAYHGPYKDVGFSFCNADGSKLEKEMFLGYGNLNPGWTMGITYEYDSQYPVSELGLNVSDYDAPRNADNTYANQSYPIGSQMTDQELMDIGLDFLDGRCCVVSNGRGTYGSDNFGLMLGISWFCDGYDQETKTVDIEGFRDKFSFFVGDGMPLEDFAPGYTPEMYWMNDGAVDILLYQPEGETGGKEKHKQLVEELREAKPYMVYTNSDGSTVEFPIAHKD